MMSSALRPTPVLLGSAFLVLFVLAPAQQVRAQSEPVRAPVLYADALSLYHNRLYQQAAHAFEAFRTRYPEDVHAAEALFYQASAELALGNEEWAIRLFDRLQTRYPAHPLAADAQLSLGRYLIERGAYDKARTVLKQMLRRQAGTPQAAYALYALGEAARAEDDAAAALDYFHRITRDYPDAPVAPEAFYAVAALHVQNGRYQAAARALEELSARYPEAPQARTLGLALAEVHYELGNYERALREIDRRLAQLEGEERARALFLRAEAHNQLGDREAAIAGYRDYVDRYPQGASYREALYGLAWNLLLTENYEAAAEYFAEVREGREDDLAQQATYYEAVSHQQAGHSGRALSLYEVTAARWPESPLADEALYEAARLHYAAERWEPAAEALERLLDTYPESALRREAFYLHGNVLTALGAPREALASYERAAASHASGTTSSAVPDAIPQSAQFLRARLLYRTGQYAIAAEAFSQYAEQYPQSAQAADALFWAAESFYQAGNIGRAQMLFGSYLRLQDSSAHADAARYALAWTFFKQGNYGGAAQRFRRFLRSYEGSGGEIPYAEDAQLRLADSYYAQKQYDRAVRAYREVSGPNQDYALYQTAQALYFDGQPAAAINTLERLLANYPQSGLRVAARYRIGDIQFQNRNYDAAITTYRDLITRHPNDPLAARAQYGIGDALYNAGRLEAAVAAYRQVLADYPGSPYVTDAATGIQYALQGQDAALDASALADSLAAAGVSASTTDELRFRAAEVEYQSGNTAEALRDFRQFVRVASDDRLLAEAYYYIGTIYADRGDYREAVNYLTQVVEAYPDSPRRLDALNRLGAIYRSQDRPERALQAYRRMEELAPGGSTDLAEARYGQSMALLALGRSREAEQLLQGVIDAAPQTPEADRARLGLARLYEQEGRLEEAASLYRRVARASRGAPGAGSLYRLGALLLEQGRPRAAIEELSRLPALFSGYTDWIARSYLAQARAFRRLGQPGTAVRLYDRVIDEFAGTPFAEPAAEEKAALQE